MLSLFQNPLVIYFLALLLFLKPTFLQDNQKIMVTYISTSLFIFSNHKLKVIIMIMLLTLFFYYEYLTESDFKRKYMVRISYKLMDFWYVMIFQYAFCRFLCFIILFEYYLNNPSDIKFVGLMMLVCSIANTLFILPWKIKSLDEVYEKMTSLCQINNLNYKCNKDFFEIVVRLEDKSYYKRKKCLTIFSFDYIYRYAIPRFIHLSVPEEHLLGTNKIKISSLLYYLTNLKKYSYYCTCFIRKIVSIVKKYFVFIINVLKQVDNILASVTVLQIKQILSRGHSTIEAQLVRSIGLETGFTRDNLINLIKRKIYEVIYTKIIFSSLEVYYKKHYYANKNRMKDYLLYLYVSTALVRHNDKSYHGLKELFNKEIDSLSQDELFIGTLFFRFSEVILNHDYILIQASIYGYSINDDTISLVLNEIEEYRNS